MSINKIRKKFQELADENPNKGNYKHGYLQALNDALDVVQLFSMHFVVGRSEQLCDYCKKPLESTICNDCAEEIDNHNH
jgi:hypothetical protein